MSGHGHGHGHDHGHVYDHPSLAGWGSGFALGYSLPPGAPRRRYACRGITGTAPMQSARVALARGAKRAPSRMWLRGDGGSLVYVFDWNQITNSSPTRPSFALEVAARDLARGRGLLQIVDGERGVRDPVPNPKCPAFFNKGFQLHPLRLLNFLPQAASHTPRERANSRARSGSAW